MRKTQYEKKAHIILGSLMTSEPCLPNKEHVILRERFDRAFLEQVTEGSAPLSCQRKWAGVNQILHCVQDDRPFFGVACLEVIFREMSFMQAGLVKRFLARRSDRHPAIQPNIVNQQSYLRALPGRYCADVLLYAQTP